MKAPDPATKPRKIQRLPEAQALRIEWADEHVCEMPYADLRRACPCTYCTTDREKATTGLRVVTGEALHDEGSLQINDISLVGTYAISLLWSDGHDTGIYPFRFLRQLCPHGGASPEAAPL